MVVKQCCCGCTLRTGTIIIGCLNLIGAAVGIMQGALVLSAQDIIDEYSVDIKGELDALIEILKITTIIITVISGLSALVSICLLAGAIVEKPVLLIPWMGFCPVYILGNTILYSICGYAYLSAGVIGTGTVCVIAAIAYFVLVMYFMVVIASYYLTLKGMI